MSYDKALYALTMANAIMLDLQDRVGSLEAGKDADFIVLSGDPLSVYTHVLQTWVEGRKVFDRSDPKDYLIAVGGLGATNEGMSNTLTASTAISEDRTNAECDFLTSCCLLPTAFCLRPTGHQGQHRLDDGGDSISNGVVLIKDGKIEAVGPASSVTIPAGYRVINAQFVTPGLIDAHSVVGLNGYLNQPHDQMAFDAGASFQPELRAIDAYNAQEKLVEWIRQFGVTTIHTGHQPSALASGQTMIAKTWGKNVDEATIVPTAMVSVTIGDGGNAGQGKSPGTRAKQGGHASCRTDQGAGEFQEGGTGEGSQIGDHGPRDQTRVPLLVTAHRRPGHSTAIRIAKEFNIRIVLDGVSDAHLVLDDIKFSSFPVIVHPTMGRAGGETENLSMVNAAKLRAAGIPVALQSWIRRLRSEDACRSV
jgi:imidazolonepropionase-like amidohydrolase